MLQIAPTDLASFLEERRAQGYLVVALEQVGMSVQGRAGVNVAGEHHERGGASFHSPGGAARWMAACT